MTLADTDEGAPGRGRALRAARAAALARRGVGAGASAGEGAGVEHLVCACGPERYGLPLAAVARVLPMRPCTPVPGAAPALVGLVALSGRIVGVLGLARALGRPDAGPAANPAPGPEGGEGHLVVLRGARPLALAVDRALGIARAAAAGAAPDPGGSEPGGSGSSDSGSVGLGEAAASGYVPAGPGGAPDFVALDLPRLLRRALP